MSCIPDVRCQWFSKCKHCQSDRRVSNHCTCSLYIRFLCKIWISQYRRLYETCNLRSKKNDPCVLISFHKEVCSNLKSMRYSLCCNVHETYTEIFRKFFFYCYKQRKKVCNTEQSSDGRVVVCVLRGSSRDKQCWLVQVCHRICLWERFVKMVKQGAMDE